VSVSFQDDNRDTNFFSGTNSHNGAILEFLSSLLDDPVDTSEVSARLIAGKDHEIM